MIDFMVNIKNKQNMTKFNIKTFVATSVLCVFFNGAAIYGMKEKKETVLTLGNNNDKGEEKLKTEEGKKETVIILENNDDKGEEKLKTEEGKNELEDKDKSGKNNITYIKMEPKVKKIRKNIQKNIFLNYRGKYSLLFCCNLCNNKEANMNEFLKEQNALELNEKKKELIEKEKDEHDNGTTILKEKKE